LEKKKCKECGAEVPLPELCHTCKNLLKYRTRGDSHAIRCIPRDTTIWLPSDNMSYDKEQEVIECSHYEPKEEKNSAKEN